MDEIGNTFESLVQHLEQQLLSLYNSPVLSGESLQLALGYRSLDALRQSISRGRFPVKLFSFEQRRGQYALTKDVAYYLAQKRLGSDD